jgi:hypothetical protein
MAQVPAESKVLGCEPDFNAYTMQANPVPDAEVTYRTASGHIHIGWTEGMDVNDPGHLEACQMLVKHLDASIGLLNAVFEPTNTRRDLYGKAGAFRPKSYGVEYRTLSNSWLLDDRYATLIFNSCCSVFNRLIKYGYKELHFDTNMLNRANDIGNLNTSSKIRDYYNHISNRLVYNIPWKQFEEIFFENKDKNEPIEILPALGGLKIDWAAVEKVKEELGDRYLRYSKRNDNSIRVYPKKIGLKKSVHSFL